MHFNRRTFLQVGLTSALFGLATGERARAGGPGKRLVVIFLRGALDGLSAVVPHGDAAYYQARPRLALPRPDQAGGVLDLDGYFGLHPALAPVLPLWQTGSLAFVHASGSPDATRSHFDAQDYMESGTPGKKSTGDGWMNRLIAALPDHSPVQAVNFGATLPRILSGRQPVANLATGRRATAALPIDHPAVETAFNALYSGSDPLSQAYQEGQTSRKALLTSLATSNQANNGARNTQGLAADATRLARLMVNNSDVQLAFLAVGGWDTHVNQAPLLNRRLGQLAEGLAALARGLGPLYNDTTVVVLSEFGRTVRENGNSGTDHGHGNVVWLLGGGLKGGKVYGQWPGLRSDQLYEGRDLAVTTDFRDVIATVLERHLRLKNIKSVFPGYAVSNRLPVWG